MVDTVGDGAQRLLILNFRPEYRAAWMQKSWYHQLPANLSGSSDPD